jgi:hypothetical protein
MFHPMLSNVLKLFGIHYDLHQWKDLQMNDVLIFPN